MHDVQYTFSIGPELPCPDFRCEHSGDDGQSSCVFSSLTGSLSLEQPQGFRQIQWNSEMLHSVRLPVFIGSGVTHYNMEHYLDAIAMIIGSHFKRGGVWGNAVDPESVKKFLGKVRLLRK